MSLLSLLMLVRSLRRVFVTSSSCNARSRFRPNRDFSGESLEQRALLSAAAAIIPLDQPPVLSGVGGTLTYMKGGAQLPIASGIAISDSDSTTLSSAIVSFNNWQTGDRLGFFNLAALQYHFSEDLNAHTASLTFTGTRTLADYQTELQTLMFFNVAANPSTATRVAQFQVNDGIFPSNTVSENIRVGQAPVLTGFDGSVTYVKGGSPVAFASNIVVSDTSSLTLQSATVSFANWQPGDRLGFVNSAGLQHVFTEDLANHKALLTFSGTASLAAYQATLRSLTFFNVAGNPVTTPRTVTIQVNDGVAASNNVSEAIVFGQAPVLSGFGGTLTYTSGGPTLLFASNIVIANPSSSTLSSATVLFVNWRTGDRLSFSNDAALQYSFKEDLTAHTAILTLSGLRSVAAWQAELRTLGFFNVAGSPENTTRIATIQVNSSGALSNSVQENIAFRFGTPVISISSASTTEGNSGVKLLPFTVTLSNPSPVPVAVAYATSNLTATAGSDYIATSGTLIIPAGQMQATINVPILGDLTPEPDESFALKLASPLNATLGVATAIGTIINDDQTISGTVISDNLSDSSAGTRLADSTHYLAISFNAGSSFRLLQSITLLMDQSIAGNVTASLYTGSGDFPATFAGALTAPANISSTQSQTTFTTNGMALLPGVKYWVVLKPISGTFHWSFTNSLAGTGDGFTTQWASSSNAGATWTSSTSSPLQISILTS